MSEDELFDFRCPHCNTIATFSPSQIGSVQECPTCEQNFIVPRHGSAVAGILPIPVRTTRLLLRRLIPADEDDLIELMSDPIAFRYIDWKPLSEGDVRKWLQTDKSTRITQPGGNLCLAAEMIQTPKVIGFVALSLADEDVRQGVFSLMVNRKYRQKGFGAEIATAALDFAFSGLSLHRVAVTCDTRNTPACRMLERVSMRREGEFIADQFLKGEWVSTFYYAVLKDEHLKRNT